jgi:hypothetical protein
MGPSLEEVPFDMEVKGGLLGRWEGNEDRGRERKGNRGTECHQSILYMPYFVQLIYANEKQEFPLTRAHFLGHGWSSS